MALGLRRVSILRVGRLTRQRNTWARLPAVTQCFASSSAQQENTTPPVLKGQSPTPTYPIKNNKSGRKSILDKLSLAGKVTVITGGARGIGLALAEATAELGSSLALLDTLEPQVDISELERRYGVPFKYYRTDVTKGESLEDSFRQVAKDCGRIDNCVTAAGISLDKPFLEHTWEESRRILDVNVLGTFFSAQLASKHMRDQGTGGNIVMIASVAAHCAIPSQRVSIYGASNGAVKLLGKTLAVEMAPFRIRVNTLSPGFIATDMTGDMAIKNPKLLEIFTNTPPLGRMGEREDLTAAVVYLLSSAAAYTTGADIPVIGGLHAGRIIV